MINLELIREAMAKKGLSAKGLSEICPVPKSTLERILSGATPNPSIQTMADVAVALELPLDDIMGISHPEPAVPTRGMSQPVQSYPYELLMHYRATISELRKWVLRLSVGCMVLVVYNMFRWILDVSNPDIGWVRLEDANLTGVLVFFLIVFAVALAFMVLKVLLPAMKKDKHHHE